VGETCVQIGCVSVGACVWVHACGCMRVRTGGDTRAALCCVAWRCVALRAASPRRYVATSPHTHTRTLLSSMRKLCLPIVNKSLSFSDTFHSTCHGGDEVGEWVGEVEVVSAVSGKR